MKLDLGSFLRPLSSAHVFVVAATRRRRDIKIPLNLSAPVRKSLTKKAMDATKNASFCVSVCKTNFTGHQTTDTINGFRDSVLVFKIQHCYHSFPLSDPSECNGM